MFESNHIVSNPSRLCCDSSVTDLKISFQHHLHLFFVIVTYVCFSSHFYWPLTFTLDDLWGTENTTDTMEYYLCTRLSVFGRMLYSAFWTPCCKFKHNENNGFSFSDGLPYLRQDPLSCRSYLPCTITRRASPSRDKHHGGASHKPEGEAGLEPVGTRDEKEVSTRLKEGLGPAGKELGRRFWGNIWDLGRSKELAPQQIRKGCVEFFRERPRDSLGQEGARARYGLGIEGRRGTWCEQTGGQGVKRETQVKVNRPHSYGAGVFHSERKLNPLKSFKQVHGVIWLIFQRRLPGVRKIYWRSRKEEKKRIQKIQGGCR